MRSRSHIVHMACRETSDYLDFRKLMYEGETLPVFGLLPVLTRAGRGCAASLTLFAYPARAVRVELRLVNVRSYQSHMVSGKLVAGFHDASVTG